MKRVILIASIACILVTAGAQKFEKVIFGCYSENLEDFENFAIRAKQSGATHINLSSEDLPRSYWQYDTPGDPYPAWVITNPGLLKISTPEALKPYLPQDYAESVIKILEDRCKILRNHGLKAAFKTFEPQMLPEKVFEDHPLWRGPRVDHPIRSRVVRWAPSIDNPEVLELYRESLEKLVRRCPEIEILTLRTNDSGTGLDWSSGLYGGKMGNTLTMDKPMSQRLEDFFSTLQKGAQNAGGKLEIDIQWTREPDPARIARNLEPGMAIENLEGPDAIPYMVQTGYLLDYFNLYYPVLGIPHPLRFLTELEESSHSQAHRHFVFIGDRYNMDLYFSIYDRFRENPTTDLIGRLKLLEKIAGDIVGEKNAGYLLKVWINLYELQKLHYFLETGGYIFYLGSVQQRWLTRPFVPFPEELKPEEKDYYRKYQFQARTEDHANDLHDLQGYQFYHGWSGRYMTHKVMEWFWKHVGDSRDQLKILQDNLDGQEKKECRLLDLRLQVFLCLIHNANNAVSYQAQLDRIKSAGIEPEFRPVWDAHSPWDKNLILETAKKEIDNTALLIELLTGTDDILLDISPSPHQDDIRLLEHNLAENLKKKLKIMNDHWLDYNRIFTITKY